MTQQAHRRRSGLWAAVFAAAGAVALFALLPDAVTGPLARFVADLWVSIMSFLVALLRPLFGG